VSVRLSKGERIRAGEQPREGHRTHAGEQPREGNRPRRRLTAEARREVIERAAAEVFAERGYHGAAMDEIARQSGVSPPVLYDHFRSKKDLHRRLLERHYAELREVWREHLAGDDAVAQRMHRAFDAWFHYLETHPYAARLLFRDTTGDPEIQALHREVQDRSRAAALPFLAREPGAENIAGPGAEAMDMAWEVFRGTLQGLALWWNEHPDVPREQVVATAMNALWLGFERVGRGERWAPDQSSRRRRKSERPPS
jgi:AcrR family transcriptional regulator